MQGKDTGIRHSRKGGVVTMPRALTEYTNPQALGGLNEPEREARKRPRPAGWIHSAGPDTLRHEPVSLHGDPGREAIRQARNNIRGRETGRISKAWQPAGIPSLIVSNALESALKRPQREELARVETFMYQHYLARLPLRAFRVQIRTAAKLIEGRLFRGKWIEIKQACNHWQESEEGPVLRKLSPVYMLSPDYLAEIARADTKRARLSSLTATKPKRQRKPRPPEGIALKTALWLSEGGIRWNPLILLSMLADPLDYFSPGEENRKGWRSLLKSWRILAGFTASRVLRPRWKLDRIGGVHASGPNLQGLNSIVRREVLTVGGFPLAELDFVSCQLNLANHLRGVDIMPDPLADLLANLRAAGIELSRSELKGTLYPLFHGRDRRGFLLRAQWDIGLTEQQAGILWEALKPLKTGSGRQLLETQARIIQGALQILAGIDARPVLPLFDAIATPEPEKVRYAMEEASRNILGEPLPLKDKTARQRSLFTG